MDRRGTKLPPLLTLAWLLLALAGLSIGCQQADRPEIARGTRRAASKATAQSSSGPATRTVSGSSGEAPPSTAGAARRAAGTPDAQSAADLELALATPDELPRAPADGPGEPAFGSPDLADFRHSDRASKGEDRGRTTSQVNRRLGRLAGLGPFRRELDLAEELARLVPHVERDTVNHHQPAPRVLLRTNLGDIEIELDPEHAPQTVSRFLKSVTGGLYDGSIFHQVVPGYIVLGGGFQSDLSEIPATTPIPNEAHNGQRNRLGTVAMARPLDAVHSATGQFFFNLADNPMLDHRGGAAENFGYTVFGRVVDGMDVLEQIAEVDTRDTERFEFLPVEPVVIEKAVLIPTAVEAATRPRAAADSPRTSPRGARR